YRTSFNIAWNLKKARIRRRAHEGKKAESAASIARAASETVAERVHEALASLDDAERTLVLEHYFDRKSLRELAGRNGCSEAGLCERDGNLGELAGRGFSSAGRPGEGE